MNMIVTISDLNTLVSTLEIAIKSDLMAREHAKSIWKEALKKSGIDVAKPVFEKKVVEEKKV